MKKILHPTDFSENASKALQFAYNLSQKTGATLVLLHVADLPTIMNSSSSASSFTDMEEELKDSVLKQLKKYATDYLTDIGSTAQLQFEARWNSSVTKGIIEAIKETEADLVVVGTKGNSKLKEVLMGSTAKGLVANATCPVFTIPEKYQLKDLKQMVYASDFNQNDKSAIKQLTEIAGLYDAEITVLHLFTKEAPEEETATFQQLLTEQLLSVYITYETRVSDHLAKALIHYLENKKADLLVMFEKENTGLVHLLFHKDLVKEFATHTTIPLLSYNIFSVRS